MGVSPQDDAALSGRANLPLPVYQAEQKYIKQRRAPFRKKHPAGADQVVPEDAPLVGLAISGGGIRSGTFGLGVLQRLAQHSLLRTVDYLCTVSGGGYIGSCLSSLMSVPRISNDTHLNDEQVARHKTASAEKGRYDLSGNMPLLDTHQVHHLRKHGNFLIARTGLYRREALRAFGTLFTGIGASLALYTVLLTALGALFILYTSLLSQGNVFAEISTRIDDTTLPSSSGFQEAVQNAAVYAKEFTKAASPKWQLFLIALAVGVVVAVPLMAVILLWPHDRYPRGQRGRSGESGLERSQRTELQLYGALVAIIGAGGAIAVRPFVPDDWLVHVGSGNNSGIAKLFAGLPLGGLTIPLAYFAGITVAGAVGYAFVVTRRPDLWNMRSRSLLGAMIGVGIYSLIAAALGWLMVGLTVYWMAASHDAMLVVTGLLAAGISRLLAGGSPTTTPKSSLAATLKSATAKVALLTAVLLFLVISAVLCVKWLVLFGANNGYVAAIAMVVAAMLFVALGYLVEFNRVSLHYFYRDRLAETYLMTERREGDQLKFTRDDYSMRLAELHDYDPPDEVKDCTGRKHNIAPYHLILCSLNLSGSRDLARKDRKSDHFVFSREFCGSTTTGYVRTGQYRNGRTKLCLAMTISGAAVSSGMGFYTSAAQAFAATLFNIRLGYWLVNPRVFDNEKTEDGKPLVYYSQHYPRPTAWADELPQRNMQAQHIKTWMEKVVFWPKYLFYEMAAATSTEQPMINLSDGGHTGDNIGLYPLLQRRCQLIIASDGEADPTYEFGSLAAAIRQIFIDENVIIDIDFSEFSTGGDNEAPVANQHYLIGRIRYPRLEGPGDDAHVGQDEQADDPRQEPSIGWLVYLKSSFVGSHEPPAVTSYQKKQPFFPHQSTGDQFFDDAQFEAYRALGNHIVETLAADVMANRLDRADSDPSDNPTSLDATAVIEFCRRRWRPSREMVTAAWIAANQHSDRAAKRLGVPKDRMKQLLNEYQLDE